MEMTVRQRRSHRTLRGRWCRQVQCRVPFADQGHALGTGSPAGASSSVHQLGQPFIRLLPPMPRRWPRTPEVGGRSGWRHGRWRSPAQGRPARGMPAARAAGSCRLMVVQGPLPSDSISTLSPASRPAQPSARASASVLKASSKSRPQQLLVDGTSRAAGDGRMVGLPVDALDSPRPSGRPGSAASYDRSPLTLAGAPRAVSYQRDVGGTTRTILDPFDLDHGDRRSGRSSR